MSARLAGVLYLGSVSPGVGLRAVEIREAVDRRLQERQPPILLDHVSEQGQGGRIPAPAPARPPPMNAAVPFVRYCRGSHRMDIVRGKRLERSDH